MQAIHFIAVDHPILAQNKLRFYVRIFGHIFHDISINVNGNLFSKFMLSSRCCILKLTGQNQVQGAVF